MVRRLASKGRAALLVGVALLIFTVDAFTPLDVAVAVLYVVVVLLSTSVFTRRGVLLTSALCLALTVLAYALSHMATFSGPALGRMLVSLAAIGITCALALKGMAATAALRAREQALRRSEAFLAGAQRISQTGSYSFRADDGVMSWSAEAARIFGYPAHVVPTGELILQRTVPEDRAAVREAMNESLHGGGPIDLRHRLQRPDGEVRHVHVLAHPMIDAQGRREYMGALRDFTEAVQGEQALHRSQVQLAHVTRVTMLGELAASIAHEVNQPLAAIVANGEASLRWLNRPAPDLDEARAAIGSLLLAGTRASDTIKRIRALARKSDPQHLALDVNAVAEEALALVARELASHQVALRTQLVSDLPAVRGDRVQLLQVLINLLMNAMQAMHDCAPGLAVLTLQTARYEHGAVCCSVGDSGAGIAADQLPRLFEAFYSTKDDGMGMGLPICRAIIDNHGGRLWASSTPGAGATFSFSLPTMDADCA